MQQVRFKLYLIEVNELEVGSSHENPIHLKFWTEHKWNIIVQKECEWYDCARLKRNIKNNYERISYQQNLSKLKLLYT